MTNLIQQFLTGRAEKQTSHISNLNAEREAQHVANSSYTPKPVSRAEFNTLVQAVHGLIEDVDAALSPEKLTAAMNAAFGEAMKGAGAAPALAANARRLGRFTPPAGDRAPLALPTDRTFLAPKGD